MTVCTSRLPVCSGCSWSVPQKKTASTVGQAGDGARRLRNERQPPTHRTNTLSLVMLATYPGMTAPCATPSRVDGSTPASAAASIEALRVSRSCFDFCTAARDVWSAAVSMSSRLTESEHVVIFKQPQQHIKHNHACRQPVGQPGGREHSSAPPEKAAAPTNEQQHTSRCCSTINGPSCVPTAREATMAAWAAG